MSSSAANAVASIARRARLLRRTTAVASPTSSVATRSYSSSSATPVDHDGRHHSSSSSSSSSAASSSSTGPRCAQPQPSTHPHLFPSYNIATPFPQLFSLPETAERNDYSYHESLRNGKAQEQLTPGITRREYEDRRSRLMEGLEDGSVVLIMGGRIKYMSGQIFYRFRQASNFWYLSGFQEPDSACVLIKDCSSPRGFKMTMFIPFADGLYEAWHGPRAGADGAVGIFGADEALEMDNEGRNLANYLKEVLPQATKIYHDPAVPPTIPRRSSKAFAASSSSSSSSSPSLLDYLSPTSPTPWDLFSTKSTFETVLRLLSDSSRCESLSPVLDSLRRVKSPSELRLMRRAGKIAGIAHNSTMTFSNTPMGQTEWGLQSHFEYVSNLLGANRPGYVPVVAAGDRGCTIHYTDNDQPLRTKEEDSGGEAAQLVCMDAGIEFCGYTSDITRAWPCISPSSATPPTFTPAQRDLYSLLLSVLHSVTRLCTADQSLSMGSLHRRSVELLRSELKQLNIHLRGSELERILYPHYLGHNLGLDLHDVPSLSRTAALAVGQVITLEPGLYIPPLHSNLHRLTSDIPDHFRGIGMRVEDDVVVGHTASQGPVVLTAEAVKEVQDVEARCRLGWEMSRSPEAQRSHSHLGATTDPTATAADADTVSQTYASSSSSSSSGGQMDLYHSYLSEDVAREVIRNPNGRGTDFSP